MKKTFILALICATMIGLFINKTHCARDCEVLRVSEHTITVEHPNGLIYKADFDNAEEYKEGNTYTFYFNELTDWEKNYELIGG